MPVAKSKEDPGHILYQMRGALARAEARLATATLEARIAQEDVTEWRKRIARSVNRRKKR